jgi:putative transposase
MPTHFHLMVYINRVDIEITEQVTQSHLLSRKRALNDSISILLRSYTRAIQKQENRTGSLFQNRTKANCVTKGDGLTPAWFQTNYGTVINVVNPETEYPQVCFNYIHENPVKDGIVKNLKDWEFSSYLDYAGFRDGKLISRERAVEFGLVI